MIIFHVLCINIPPPHEQPYSVLPFAPIVHKPPLLPQMKLLLVVPSEHLLRKQPNVRFPLDFPEHEIDYAENTPGPAQLRAYDQVIVAHCPPKQDGLARCQALREQNPHLSLGILARSLTREEVEQALESGAQNFFFLPSSDETEVPGPAANSPVQRANGTSLGGQFRQWVQRFLVPERAALHFLPPEFAGNPAGNTLAKPALWVKFFGQFAIIHNGQQLPISLPRKERMLLVFFLQNYRRSISITELLENFWDNALADSARNSFNVALNHIRDWAKKTLPEAGNGFINYKDGFYFVNPALPITTDAEQFARWFQEGRSHEAHHVPDQALECFDRAHQLYAGKYLEEFAGESWVETQAYRYQTQSLGMMMKLSRYFLEQKDWGTAREICQKLLVEDGCIEEAYQHLFAVHAARGERIAAEKTFLLCRENLRKCLDSEPSRSTRQLFAHAQAGDLEAILAVLDN